MMDETEADLWQSYEDAGTKTYAQGRYAEAEQQFKSALQAAEAFGTDNPHLATSLNSLGQVYRAQGRYAEAEPLLKRALALREQILGPEDPVLAQSLHNLAALYTAQSR